MSANSAASQVPSFDPALVQQLMQLMTVLQQSQQPAVSSGQGTIEVPVHPPASAPNVQHPQDTGIFVGEFDDSLASSMAPAATLEEDFESDDASDSSQSPRKRALGVGASFTSLDDFKAAIQKLATRELRQSRVGHATAQRRAIYCATHRVRKHPCKVSGACPFFIMITADASGGWTVTSCNLRHECTTKANTDSIRRQLGADPSTALKAARTVVATAAHGGGAKALSTFLRTSEGVSVSPNVAGRALAEANGEKRQALEDDQYGALVAYVRAHDAKAEDNVGIVECSETGVFERCLVVIGAAVEMQRTGFLTSVFSFDFSFMNARVSERRAMEAVGGDDDDIGPQAVGRPRMAHVGLGCLAAIVARTVIGTRVLVALAVVPTEDGEQAKWVIEHGLSFYPADTPITFLMDRSASLSLAVKAVFAEELLHIVHCYPHFKRNVNANSTSLKLPIAQKSAIESLLWKAHRSLTTEDFDQYMDKINAISMEACQYIKVLDPKHWAICHIPANLFGNYTSNDVEGFFGTNSKDKNCAGVFVTFEKAIASAASAIYKVKLTAQRAVNRGVSLPTTALKKELTRLETSASTHYLLARIEDDHVYVVCLACTPTMEYKVDLTLIANGQQPNYKTMCSCLANGTQLLPCVHVVYVVTQHGAFDRDILRVLRPGITSAEVAKSICAFKTVAKTSLRPAVGVLTPNWVTVDLPRNKVPASALADAKPVRRSDPAVNFSLGMGARMRSDGELDTVEVAKDRQRADANQQRFRLRLGPAAPNKRTNYGTDVSSSQAKRQRLCPICKEAGHYKKTCPDRMKASQSDQAGEAEDEQ